ncbi:DNA cytosine methyltransferase [Pseudomonas sp. LJDD11]|uniref:DNA cytosine methyltransferase n=1 Tax=Pseudomonas sp. LJDD11 TaxID=2931984 RepID=UPI00211C80FF|nr:DNA cytosine methyltransferase [Pseudomonas sp. LJDD11]MCQ9422307.1 DNA cytosine methyltransferase [Pseudomonas sp. LJDD11]
MKTFTTLITSKIGESRGVARIWLEGHKLLKAGIKIGARYSLQVAEKRARLELVPLDSSADSARMVTVSKRERHGIITPLLEIRSELLRQLFTTAEKVRIVIRLGRIAVTAIDRDERVTERLSRLRHKLQTGEPLAVCSLFHGGGVLDRAIHSGLARQGIDCYTRIGIELEEPYLDASLRNNPMLWREDSFAICSDIRDIRRGDDIPLCDLVIAGIPCTGASRSGKAKNKLLATEDHPTAGALFVDFLDFVRYCNPAMAILENVPDYLTSTSMMVIRSVLGALGYRLFECILDGNTFGALENRSRMAVVAYTEGVFDSLEQQDLLPLRTKEATLAEVLDNVAPDHESWKPYDYLQLKEQRDMASGKGFRRQLLTAQALGCGCIGRGYAKARSTEPFIQHPTDPGLSRLLTVAEHARVKTIPVELVQGVSDTTAHEILGQSVIFAAFEALAVMVGSKLKWLEVSRRVALVA